MRKLIGITVIIAIALVAFVPVANAAPWTPKPKKSHYGFKWANSGCKVTKSGQVRAYGTAQAWVYKLKSKHGMYRQKIKVQIDYNRRTNPGAKPDWDQVDGTTGVKKYVDANGVTQDHWFQKGADATALGIGLPDGIQQNHNTGMQPNGATLTAKATVTLQSSLAHNAVWKYTKRSKRFTCPDPTDMYLPPTATPPSANGGS